MNPERGRRAEGARAAGAVLVASSCAGARRPMCHGAPALPVLREPRTPEPGCITLAVTLPDGRHGVVHLPGDCRIIVERPPAPPPQLRLLREEA